MKDAPITITKETWMSVAIVQYMSWFWFVYHDRLALSCIVGMFCTVLISEFVLKTSVEFYKEM